jgi:hypothetical protein
MGAFNSSQSKIFEEVVGLQLPGRDNNNQSQYPTNRLFHMLGLKKIFGFYAYSSQQYLN